MRVTSQMRQASTMHQITTNYARMTALSDKISAERQILNLRDNASGSIAAIRLQTTISRTEQYNRTIQTAVGSLSTVDGYLANVKASLDEVKTTLTKAASDPSADGRAANVAELRELLSMLVGSANAHDGEKYLFGGTASAKEPFSITEGGYVLYNGNNDPITVKTGDSTTATVNCSATEAFGTLTTVVDGAKMSVRCNLGTDTSTPLAALNGGKGVPSGKIVVRYSAYPDGLEVDLSGCDTLEDVKDTIERATLEASRALDPKTASWLNADNLDWRDLQDRYVEVALNPDGTGLSLAEMDLGEPLPDPTNAEAAKGLTYSGAPGYTAGGVGGGAGAVYDNPDYVYGDGATAYAALRVDDLHGSGVASALGIKGTAHPYDAANPDPVLDGKLVGQALNPALTGDTLLADLGEYFDAVYTIANGAKPGAVSLTETSDDTQNTFHNWTLNNLSKGANTGPDGELYARVTQRGAPDNDLYVEVYTVPLDRAKSTDLVATGTLGNQQGGTVMLSEANGSGITGTVGIVMGVTAKTDQVSLQAAFSGGYQATVHVPAFVEETGADGVSRDANKLLSGWQITGLDKPPAASYDRNHPASTDLDGDVTVNVGVVDNGDGTSSVVIELYRPAFADQPAELIATGSMNLGGHPPLATTVDGSVNFVGAEGHEQVGGSVYLEWPAGMTTTAGVVGAGAGAATTHAFTLAADVAAGETLHLGGAMTLTADLALAADMILQEDTTFLAGQVFTADVRLPNGGVLPAGMALPADTTFPLGTMIGAGTVVQAGTTLQGHQDLAIAGPLAAGTVIPAGSYTHGGAGFATDAIVDGNGATAGEPLAFDVRATFATLDDWMRAVNESGVYVTAQLGDSGVELVSQLCGAYLTVSEDVSVYEPMGDVHDQLNALDLNGLVKGVNSDVDGKVYFETIYYPPDHSRTDGMVMVVSADGEQQLIEAGYYVRAYRDQSALDVDYADRDHSTLVAQGFIPAGELDTSPGADPLNPYVDPAGGVLGAARPLVLKAMNGSGLSGTVTFDYYGGRDQIDAVSGDFAALNNKDIAVAPGGLRSVGSAHTTIQQIDVAGFAPGVHADYGGTAHATIARDAAANTTTVCVYRDASNTRMTAKGELNGDTGVVTLYEVTAAGDYILDANGDRVPAGSLVVAANTLPDGATESFTIEVGSPQISGQQIADNVFANIQAAIDALKTNDAETIHDLIDVAKGDIDRVLQAAATVGSRIQRLEALADRYAENLIAYDSQLNAEVGMDTNELARAIMEFSAAQNAYNATLQMAGQLSGMSLLDYLQ